jgi:hydrogenase maturation protease
VTLVDAASGMEVGEIMEWNARREPLPSSWNMTSSHYVGIAEAIELSRSLGRLPAQLKVLAIGGGQFDVGNPLSTEVQRAIKLVVNRLQEYALN